MKEKTKKQAKPTRILKENRQKKTIKEDKGQRQTRIEEKRREDTNFSGEGDFENGQFKKIGFYSNEKVMDKRPYSNKETLIEVINSKNKRYINKKHENKEYIFLNNFKHEKGKILLYYINIIILMILNLSINSFPYILLTIPGPGKSSVFFEDVGGNYLEFCFRKTYPSKIYINNIEQENISSEYYLNEPENIVKLEFNNSLNTLNLGCHFFLCSNITKIDFTYFDFDILSYKSFGGLFNGCTSLKSVNFSNLDTSIIDYMGHMFYDCTSLESIDLTNFKTSQLKDMKFMFCNCKKLVSLNLSNFDISSVTTMEHMFEGCESLVSLDLFTTRNTIITSIEGMFYNCYKLTLIDLSNLVSTNELKFMGSAFRNCVSLKYINISNLVTTNVTHMDFVFYNCTSLTSLNLSNFDFSTLG